MKSVSVWLILKDGANSGKTFLQRRSATEDQKPQSYPFVLQSSVSGKVEPGESIEQAVKRETQEELGPNFKLPELEFFYKSKYNIGKKLAESHNFRGFVFQSDLAKINLHSGAETDLIFLGKQDLPNLKPFNNNTNPKEEFVLFADQLEALKKLF